MTNNYEQRFFSALRGLFVGNNIRGESGFVNLLSIKNQYFKEIKPYIEKKINETIEKSAREELYEKLYSFFDCYFNETGTVFFANSQLHKNLYEKVYSERSDVSLFWKTQKLYYVKSGYKFDDLETDVQDVIYKFDTSDLKQADDNEKIDLDFFLIEVNNRSLLFKVRNAQRRDFTRLKNYLAIKDTKEILDFLLNNFGKSIHPNITFSDKNLDATHISSRTDKRKCIFINNLNDIDETVEIEFSISAASSLSLIEEYCTNKNIPVSVNNLTNAFSKFKKQNEIDYFIHKDALSFLKEQFNLYIFNWYLNDLQTKFDTKTIERIQKIKGIAELVISYISKFESELKSIWEKPKFVRKSNYVLSLDKLKNKINLIKKIIDNKGFDDQIEEWNALGFIDETFSRDEIIVDGALNENHKTKPIDTKHFGKLKWEILDSFEFIDNELDGILIKSDNYQALNTISAKYKNQIDLIYIDPPFNTGSDFLYKDKYQNSTWLTLMKDRLDFITTFLKSVGALYLHLDENANYYGRILLENLGFDNIQELTFDTNATKDTEADLFGFKSFGKRFVLKHNTIYYCFNNQNQFRKLWKPNRNKTDLQIGWLDLISKPKIDKPKKIVDFKYFIEKYNDEGDLRNYEIDISNETIFPLGDFWNDIYSFTQSEMRVSENISFTTQKPENLLRRIIQSSTKENQFVMDFFLGSGTTIAVAHKLSRKWIGIEFGENFYEFYKDFNNGDYTIKLGIIGRLKNVINGDKTFHAADKQRRSHLSSDINWNGGGFFKYYELEQYEETLAKAQYEKFNTDNETEENILDHYTFSTSQKLLDAISIDYDKYHSEINFEKLYPDIDIAETLSNITGFKLKRVSENSCILVDSSNKNEEIEIFYDQMTFEEFPWVKPLIWWHSEGKKSNE